MATSAEMFDRVELVVFAGGLVVFLLWAGNTSSARASRTAGPRPSAGRLVWNFLTGAPLVPFRPLRGMARPAVAAARVGTLAGMGGAALVALVAGPVALAVAAAATAVVGLVVRRLVFEWRAWLKAQGLWADVALGWLLVNFVTGAPVVVGPPMWDVSERWEIARARARKAAPRLAAVTAVGAAVYRLVTVPFGLGGPLWVTPVAGLVWPLAAAGLVWLAVRWLVERAHYRRWVLPLHLALHGVVGFPLEGDPRRYLTVPREKAQAEDGVIVGLGSTFTFEDKKKSLVYELTKRKLALEDVTEHFEGKAGHSYLQIRPKAHAPATAYFGEVKVRELVERAKPSAPLIGLGVGDEPVAFDLDTETPHVLWSSGTGGFKSSTLRSIACQLMHHGAVTVVIDLKRHSQPWLRGLPGVIYVRDPEDIHDMFLWLAAEGDRRNRAWDDVPTGGQGPKFPRLVVLCEELNATFDKLRRYWRSVKPSGAPQLSPAVEGFKDLLFMGRAVQIHVLAVTQMGSAKDLGGPEARENFGLRILARYSLNAWKMLVPEISYRPSPTVPGRIMVCRAATAFETQAVFFTDTQAQEWAAAGTRPPDLRIDLSQVSQGERTPVPQGEHPETVSASPVPTLTVVDGNGDGAGGGERGVTLSEASADRGRGVVPEKLHNLRKALQRDPEAPEPIGGRKVRGGTADVYDPDELVWWHRNRPGTKGVRK